MELPSRNLLIGLTIAASLIAVAALSLQLWFTLAGALLTLAGLTEALWRRRRAAVRDGIEAAERRKMDDSAPAPEAN